MEEHSNALFIYSPVNHETGAVQDCPGLWDICAPAGARIFLDAPQAMARLEWEKWMPWCHGFSFSGQKIYGLKGTGLLYLKSPSPPDPGSSEGGLSLELDPEQPVPGGTPDIPSASSVIRAAEIYAHSLSEQLQYWRVLTEEGVQILSSGDFSLEILSPSDRVPGVLCISLPDLLKYNKTMEDLFYHLNKEGIFLSRFSACTGSVIGASRILKEMGFTGELSRCSLRISLGRDSKRDDFFRLKKALTAFFTRNAS